MSLRYTPKAIDESSPFVLTALFWLVVFVIILGAVGLGVYWVTAPTQVAIQNRIFHNSQAYNDGMARDLDNMRLAYAQADSVGKDTIRATVRHRFAGYNAATLPPDLQAFLQQVRQ